MRWLLLLLLLNGCFTTPVVKQYEKDEVTIRWIRTDKVKEICRNDRALACALPEASPCLIWTYPDPSWETLGHEVGHCFLGRWHD